MEVGVHGRMEAVVRTVVVEPREEPDRVTTHHQVMVERTAWNLVLQTDNVIHNPVQVIGPLHPAFHRYGDRVASAIGFSVLYMCVLCLFLLALLIFGCVGQNQRASHKTWSWPFVKIRIVHLKASKGN